MLLYLGNQHASVRAANLHRIVYRRQDDFPIATFRRRVKTYVNYRAYNLGYTSFYFLLHTLFILYFKYQSRCKDSVNLL
jgi:hypothetical protein